MKQKNQWKVNKFKVYNFFNINNINLKIILLIIQAKYQKDR